MVARALPTFDVDSASSPFDLTATDGVADFHGAPANSLLGTLAGLSVPLAGWTPTTITSFGDPASIETVGEVMTLRLFVTAFDEDCVSGSAINLTLEGTIVGTIPEPGALALAIAGWLVALGGRRRDTRRL